MNTSIAIIGSDSPGQPVPVPIVVGRVVLAPSPKDPTTFNPHPRHLVLDTKQLLLVRIRKADALQLDEMRRIELPTTPDLSTRAREELYDAIVVRRAELKVLSARCQVSGPAEAELFHVEHMGEFGGLFGTLGRTLQREPKNAAGYAHAQALAEELARLLSLKGVELRQDASGCVKRTS